LKTGSWKPVEFSSEAEENFRRWEQLPSNVTEDSILCVVVICKKSVTRVIVMMEKLVE
jgi:hypothetical protein